MKGGSHDRLLLKPIDVSAFSYITLLSDKGYPDKYHLRFLKIEHQIRSLSDKHELGWPIDLENALFGVPELVKDVGCAPPPRQVAFKATGFARNDYKLFTSEYAAHYLFSVSEVLQISDLKKAARLLTLSDDIATARMSTPCRESGCIVLYEERGRIFSKLSRLLRRLSSSPMVTSSVLIDALAFYIDFMILHPFKDGNGRIARLLFQKRLQVLGLIERPICPLGPLLVHKKAEVFNSLLDLELNENQDSILSIFLSYVTRLVEILNGDILNYR